MKVQHALRALRQTTESRLNNCAELSGFRFYNIEELLTSMGTGEAAVTVLSEKEIHTACGNSVMRSGIEDGYT